MRRRELLRAALLAAAGLVLPGALQACGSRSPGAASPRSLEGLTEARLRAGTRKGLSVFLAGEDYAAEIDNYLGFGLVGAKGVPLFGSEARIWLVPSADPDRRVTPLGPFPAPWRAYSHPEPAGPEGINAADVRFDQPGVWTILVEADQPGGRVLGTAALQVKAKGSTATRIPGAGAIPSLTPTVEDHRGVEPICTREPPCDMHQVTLAEALGMGKPTAFIVATPKFCMSRTCGPNLEELVTVEKEIGGRASFVHAEVYKDDRPDTISNQVVSPTFGEWGFDSEPWLFLIGRDGVISSRFEGPITAPEVRSAMASLLG